MSRTTTTLLFGSIFALMSAGAIAGDTSGKKEVGKEYGTGVGMMNIDTDKDEFSAHTDKRFKDADKNKDGFLDENESNTLWKNGDIDGPYHDENPGNT